MPDGLTEPGAEWSVHLERVTFDGVNGVTTIIVSKADGSPRFCTICQLGARSPCRHFEREPFVRATPERPKVESQGAGLGEEEPRPRDPREHCW